MDEVIYFVSENGLYLLLAIALVKIVVIMLYKGLDVGYVLENFLIIYTSSGIEYNPARHRFRLVHNILTIIFYFVVLAWLTIGAVLSVTK